MVYQIYDTSCGACHKDVHAGQFSGAPYQSRCESCHTETGFKSTSFTVAQHAATQETLRDLINRTYHLNFTYNNPDSRWIAGIGRLYIPWASSLSTIDGFYAGRRYGRTSIGVFGGSTPDPTSWNYDRHRQMAGSFVNFAGGKFESLRYSSTSGLALSRIRWRPDRQFGFFENSIFCKHHVSVYSDLECDLRNAAQNGGQDRMALSRSYLTVRLQPHPIISFDINENYYRNIPTFDPRLVGTGLIDQFLFQGVSGGIRLDLPLRLGVYSNVGRSSRTGDVKPSLNYLYGLMDGNVLKTGIRADFQYSRFDSSFGQGHYRSLTVNREIGRFLRFDLQMGQQNSVFASSGKTDARFINADFDWMSGRHYLVQSGITLYRGQNQNYNQYYVSVGYRFDLHRGGGIQPMP